jgi:hypothetical protein
MPPVAAVLQVVGAVLGSRLGQIIIAAVLAYGYGHHRANVAWEARVAAQEAALKQAHAEELAREAEATREIGAAATARAEVDAAVAAELRAKIDHLKIEEPADAPPIVRTVRVPAAPRSCAIDDAFARSVRQFDASARTPAPARRSR